MASKLVQCKKCQHQFRIEYLKHCPNCLAIDITADSGSGGGGSLYTIAVIVALGGLIAALSSAWSEYSQSS
jgi:hypothetical protein